MFNKSKQQIIEFIERNVNKDEKNCKILKKLNIFLNFLKLERIHILKYS